MSWLKLARRIHLSPYLHRNSQHVAFEKSRCMPEALEPSCNVSGANTRYGRHCGYDILDHNSIFKFSTGPLAITSQFSPLHCLSFGRPLSLLSIQRPYTSHALREKKSKKMFLYLTALVFAMVGLSYAAVPLYRTFCQATGYGGTIQRRETVEQKIARHSKDGTVTSREIIVQFNSDVSDGLQWKFIPTQRQVRVKPGESALAFYTAENKSSSPITGVSTYNITPMKNTIRRQTQMCLTWANSRPEL